MDYLPKGQAVVERDRNNRVIRVIAVWQGKKIPFVQIANKKVIREDHLNLLKPLIPAAHYRKIYRQVCSVFADNQTKTEDLYWLVRDLNHCGVFLNGGGRLEVTRWDKEAGQRPKLVRQKVKDLDSAIRMQGHIIDRYSISRERSLGELDQLESIDLVITEANQVLQNWRYAQAGEKERLQKRLAGVVLQLEKCRNEFKVAARVQAKKIIPLKDSLGRPNPGAFAARTIAALNDLTERIKELNIIMPYIAMRKQLLILADRWLKSKFRQAYGIITLIARHRVFKDGTIAGHEAKIIGQKIDQAVALLNSAVITPYFERAREAQAELRSAKKSLQEKNYRSCGQKLKLALENLADAA